MAVINLDTGLKERQKQVRPPVAATPDRDISEGMSPFRAFAISAGRGMTNIARAVGLADEESEAAKVQLTNLENRFPIASEAGQIVGEAAPFLVPGTAIGAIPSVGGRVLAAAGLGALEGGAIARGRGEELEGQIKSAGIGGAIGGTFEALFPIIGRMGSLVISKVTGKAPKGAVVKPDGTPTPELDEALAVAGLSFDDLTDEAASILKQPSGSRPEEVARMAMFEQLDVPYSAGDISQDFGTQSFEQRLAESSAESLGDPMRSLRLQQSESLTARLDEVVSNLGVPEDIGESVKAALSGRLKDLKTTKNQLYKDVAETAPEINAIPIALDGITDAVPDTAKIRRISRIKGNQTEAVSDLLVEFGVNQDPKSVDAFLKSGGKIDQLNVGNFEEFRVALGQIERADQTGATSVITGPIRRALDEEATLIDNAIQGAGISSDSVLAPLKEARATVRQIKTEFSPQAITGRLTDVKKDGVTPIIEASKVYRELMREAAPIENLERVMLSLSKSGRKGRDAVKNMQASAVTDLLNEAFKAETRRIEGAKTFGSVAFIKKLNKIKPQLGVLFKDNPKTLKQLELIGKAAEALTPPSGAVPKGSASVVLDAFHKMGMFSLTSKFPPLAGMVEIFRKASQAGADRAMLEKSLNATPSIKRTVTIMQREMPNLAASIGIAGIGIQEDEEGK